MRATNTVLAALLCVAAACRDSATEVPAPGDVVTTDVAVVAGAAAHEDVGVIYTQFGAFSVPTGDIGPFPGWSPVCPYDAITGRFTCPPLTAAGRTMARSYAFMDAAGAPQSAYHAETTASANFRSTLSGTFSREGLTATISHDRDITVSGLVGSETQHTIDGVASTNQMQTRHSDRGERTYSMSSVATIQRVVIPFPRSRGAWPLSGSIRRDFTATRHGVPGTQTRVTTTTFNGTRFATLTVGDRHFTLDLATGRIVPTR